MPRADNGRRVHLGTVARLANGEQRAVGEPVPPNTNPYVSRLLTLYSQSKRSNAGTRGLDVISEQTYVETALDRDLVPAVLAGEFRLVLITGQRRRRQDGLPPEARAASRGRAGDRRSLRCRTARGSRCVAVRSCRTTTAARTRASRRTTTSCAPSSRRSRAATSLPGPATRSASSPSTRAVSSTSSTRTRRDFPLLARSFAKRAAHRRARRRRGRRQPQPAQRRPDSWNSAKACDESILGAATLRRLTHEQFWEPCQGCDLKDRCYAFHNARTFQDRDAGAQRASSGSRASTRSRICAGGCTSRCATCARRSRTCWWARATASEIHELYRTGERDEIAQGFYFNSWMGGDAAERGSPAHAAQGRRRRRGRRSAARPRARLRLADARTARCSASTQRGNYDRDDPAQPLRRAAARRLRAAQPRSAARRTGATSRWRDGARSSSVATAAGGRCCRTGRPSGMLAARARRRSEPRWPARPLLVAINRGEGLHDPSASGSSSRCRCGEVERGTVQSYRLFPRSASRLVARRASRARVRRAHADRPRAALRGRDGQPRPNCSSASTSSRCSSA